MAKSAKPDPSQIRRQNVLESLKDIGKSATDQALDLVEDTADGFVDQILGKDSKNTLSGDINPGEEIEFGDLYTIRQKEEKQRLGEMMAFERKMREEEEVVVEKKKNELRMQIKVLQERIITLSERTQGLASELQVAAMQAPVEPGLYHLVFFEKFVEELMKIIARIEDTSSWLHHVNKRAQKKNFWGQYKKLGGSLLLSGEHYLTRSAG